MKLPSIKRKVTRELASARLDMQDKLATYDDALALSRNISLPHQGKSIDWLKEELEKMEQMKGASEWKDGKVSGAVYYGDNGVVDEAIRVSMMKHLLANRKAIHPFCYAAKLLLAYCMFEPQHSIQTFSLKFAKWKARSSRWCSICTALQPRQQVPQHLGGQSPYCWLARRSEYLTGLFAHTLVYGPST